MSANTAAAEPCTAETDKHHHQIKYLMSTKTRCMIPAAQQEEIRPANLGLKRNLGECVCVCARG